MKTAALHLLFIMRRIYARRDVTVAVCSRLISSNIRKVVDPARYGVPDRDASLLIKLKTETYILISVEDLNPHFFLSIVHIQKKGCLVE